MRAIIRVIACMLLAITYAQAQSNAQSKDPQSLRGLNGVRLTISFGRADALDAERRPAVLKALQDDAQEKFIRAGIPLLKFAQEVESAPGSPHFRVIVTLDKPNGYVFPVVTESRLFQKARLSRDPSAELLVSTWESHSVGAYDVKDFDMLRMQVGKEVDEFIRAYLIANPESR